MRKAGAPSNAGMVVQTLQVGFRQYELRYQLCHKANCTPCYGRGEEYCGPPGHGPYWYMCVQAKNRWTRIYIGKTLDTTRFVKPDGSVDWEAIRKRREERGKKK